LTNLSQKDYEGVFGKKLSENSYKPYLLMQQLQLIGHIFVADSWLVAIQSVTHEGLRKKQHTYVRSDMQKSHFK